MIKKDKNTNFTKTLIGSIIFNLSLSPLTPITSLSVYITSYIHIKQKWVTMHYGNFFVTINQISMTLMGSIAGILENKIGFYNTILIGSIITIISLLGFYYIQDIYLFYFFICLMGIGNGLCIPLPMKNLLLYIPEKKGLFSSLMMIPQVFFSSIFGFLGEKIINKNGYTLNIEKKEIFYPENICKNIKTYFLFCIFFLPIGRIISLFLIKEYKNENILKKTKSSIIDSAIKQALNNKRFWLIVSISFFCAFNQQFILNTSRTFCALIGINGSILQYLSLIQSLSMIIISPIFGIFVDKFGSKYILMILTFLCSLIGFGFGFFFDKTIMFIIFNILNVIIFIGFINTMNPHIMHVFGIKYSLILSGVYGLFRTLSSIIVSSSSFIISKYYFGELIKIPFRICYLIGGCLCIISFILTCFDNDEPFEYDNELDRSYLSSQEIENEVKFDDYSYIELEEE
jgi:MFS family permease